MKLYAYLYYDLNKEADCDRIRHQLHLQTLASVAPKKITHPKPWEPRTALDKAIARNMIRNMSIPEIIELFPTMPVYLVDAIKGQKYGNTRASTT